MSNDDWDTWATYHATIHRFAGMEDVAMLNTWREAFSARGYTADELRAASLRLAESEPRRWRTEHLEFLLSSVAGRRLAQAQAERDAEDARHAGDRCRLCSDSGLVAVPHHKAIAGGEWTHPYYTCVVACSCYRGQRQSVDNERQRLADAERSRKGGPRVPRLWSIAEYEGHHPDWELLAQTREVKRETERRARDETRYSDKRQGPLRLTADVRRLIEEAKQEANP